MNDIAIPSSFFSDHGRKDIIRKLWCKPLIEALSTNLKKKLIYIGLPDIEALDILEWINYLDRVIAFQCSSYKDNKKIDVAKLDALLNKLEQQSKLRSSIVYQGWMEEIVMGGISERGQIYSQSDFLKVYNLDFCSNLTVPRKVVNDRGRIINLIYKTDVIEKFIEYQALAGSQNKGQKFIMYLTVNSNTFDQDLAEIKDPCIKAYLKKISAIRKVEVVAVRQMKAYCYHKLNQIFLKHNFHCEFLPPVFYMGSAYPNKETRKLVNHRMMTFTILGTLKKDGEVLFKQDCEAFLNNKFIFATDKAISCYNDERYIKEVDYDSNIKELINDSHTYQNLWAMAV